jgi:hypothetical protein
MASKHYARNLRYRQALRDEGLCIDCLCPVEANCEHWRCRDCRRIESRKQVIRYRTTKSISKVLTTS